MSKSKAQHNGFFTRIAEAVGGFSDPSMGDEREREITMRSYTVALSLGTVLFLALGVVLAAIGHWWIAFAVVILSGLQSLIAVAYAQENGLDLMAQSQKTSPQRKRFTTVAVAVVLFLLLGARIFQLLVGHPLLNNSAEMTTQTSPSQALGMVCGAGAALIVLAISSKRRRAELEREQQNAANVPDED